MPGGGAEEKTEKATPKRRRDERKKGNVLMSRDVVAVATLLGTLVMLRVMSGIVMQRGTICCAPALTTSAGVPPASWRRSAGSC